MTLCAWNIAVAGEADTVVPLVHDDLSPPPPPQIRAPQEVDQLRQELAQAEARQAQGRAELLLQEGRDEEAADALSQARDALAPFSETPMVRSELQRINQLIHLCRERSRIAADSAATASGKAEVADAVTARDAAKASEAAIFHERLARIKAHYGLGHIELALAECRRLLVDYANEPEVNRLFAQLLAAAHEERRLDVKERREELLQEVHERIGRSMIPTGFDGRLSYPEDWAERTRLPRTQLEAPTELPPWQAQLLESLQVRVSLNVDQIDAVELLTALARQHHINLIIDPSLLTGDHKTVTLNVNNITLEHLLSWACQEIGSDWTMAKGAIYIGGMAEHEPVIAVYDIGEVIFQVVDQARPPGMALASTYGGAGRGGAANANQKTQAAGGEATPVVAPEDLVDHLQKAVSPETWKDAQYGITIHGTILIVTAPPRVHVLIREFIRSMSHANRRLAQVDARWLQIDDSYLEEIGVNWESGNLLLPIGADNQGYHRATRDYDFSGSSNNILPGVAVAPNPPTFGTGLNLNATWVAATQLSAILSAVERNRRATVLIEPTVTTISGVRATTQITKQLAYISGYTVGAGGGNGLSAPLATQTNVLMTGGNLDVKPYVSSDGKYVFMEFAAALSSLADFTQINMQSIRTFPTGFNPAGNGGIGAPILGVSVNSLPVEVPNLLLNELHTYVEIPDGGSLLVGGFANYADQTTSTGIPFLSDIPFLGRLFGQRGRYSTRVKLCLLVSVRVIDFKELENMQ